MKLHLPSMLRKAVLSCMAVVASLSTTVATGVLTGGVVAWAIAAQQAQADWGPQNTGDDQRNTYYVTGNVTDDWSTLQSAIQDDNTTYFIRADSSGSGNTATMSKVTIEANDPLIITGHWNNTSARFEALTITELEAKEGSTLQVGGSQGTASEQNVTILSQTGTLSSLTVAAQAKLTLGGDGAPESNWSGIKDITIKENGILEFHYGNGINNTDDAVDILLQGGAINLRNGAGAYTTLHADITVDGAGTIAGSRFGDGTTVSGSITGTGTLTFAKELVNHGTNTMTISAPITDGAEGALALVIDGTKVKLIGTNTYTGGTTIGATGELQLGKNGNGSTSFIKGDVDVYGTLKFIGGDATGYGNSAQTISAINVYTGGTLNVESTANQTAAGLAINLQGGTLTGASGSNIDLFYGGGNKYATISALAADGATADTPTESTISGVQLGIRQRENVISVAEHARLSISSVIADRTGQGYGNNNPPSTPAIVTLNKTGLGELVLSGANTYTQGTIVEAGTLTLANGGVLNSVVTVNNGATFQLEGGSTYGAASVAGDGSTIKTGAGIAQLTAATTVPSLDIQEGFVQAGAALTLNNLTVSNGAGFAYDISGMTEETAAAITATNYSGALTIKLLGASAGTYKLANVSGAMSGDDVTFVGLSDRMLATATVAADGLLSVTLDAGAAMDLTWDVAGPSNEWASSGDTNWDAAGSDTAFINGDSVTFAGEGEEITISGTVAPNNMTVSGTGYVFEGGSIAATGKLTVAASADAHIKSQASFAGGVEVNGTLTITDTTTSVNTRSALGTISGAGNVVLNLVENNGIGFDFSGMTGGNVNVNAGRLQLNQCLFNTAADATLPRIKLTNTGDLVFNGNVDVRNNVEIEGDISPDVYVNETASAAKMYGSITGGDNATLRVQGSGTWTLYGDANVGTLSLFGATTNIASEVDVRDFSAAGGTIVLENGAVVTAETLRLSNERNSTSTMTINAGAKMTVSGTTYEDSNQDSLMIAHWSGNSVLKLNGGEFDASDAVMQLSWTGKGTFEAISGTADVKGITFNAQDAGVKGVLKLGTADGTDALKVNIGSHGITYVQGDNVTFELGNGTLAATADWAMTGNGTVNLVGTTGTKIDTGAYTVQIAPTLSGSGKLIKAGSGTLEIGAATTTLEDVSIQEGFVQAGAALTLTNLAGSDAAGFAYDLATGANKVTASNYSGAITLKLASLAETEGVELFQGSSAGLIKDDITLEYSAGGRVSVTLDEASLATGLVKVAVSIAGTPLDNLVWNTGHADNVWAAGGATNWTSDGNEEQFLNGDSVTFSGAGETISISGTVAPKAITVTGTGYVLEGSGSIGGTGSLTVRNGGELTIVSANSYTGGTTIEEGGVLVVKHVQAIGEGIENEYIRAFSGSGTMAFNTGGSVKLNGDVLADFSGTLELRSGSLRTYNVSTNELAKAINLNLAPGTSINTDSGGLNVSGTVRFNLVAINDDIPEYDKEGTFTFNNYWGSDMRLSGLVEGDGIVKINPTWTNQSLSLLNNNNTFAGTYKVQIGSSNADWSDQSAALILGAQYAAKDATVELVAEAERLARLRLDTSATVKSLKSAVSDKNVVTSSVVATLTVTEGDFGGSIQNGSDANVLSLTKQGDAGTTLVLRGANSYTGATTINGGTLELAAGAELASELITVAGGAVLAVNEGIYASTYVDGTGTIEKRAEAALDYVDLAGLADTFAGTIDVQGGNLRLGDTLEIKTGRTLKAGANGVYLNNGLTLSGGKLALDYTTAADAEITMLNLSENALTLLAGNTLSLSGLVLDTQQDNTVDLLTGVGSLLGSDGNALDLTGALASTYFSTIEGLGSDIDTTTLGLQLADGKLQLVIPEQTHYLVWGEGTGTWEAGQDFTAEDQDFTSGADVKFGALTAESETVTISGAVAAGKVLIDGGEGKTYVFAADDTSGIASAESITVNSGTACFWEGSLDMTADTTLAVNDGATLLLNNGAIADADAVDIVLNDGSTLEWNADNNTDYSTSMDVADGAKITLVNGNGTSKNVNLTAGSINAAGETATVTLEGGYFQLDSETVYGDIVIASDARMELMRSSTPFAQDISGEGGIFVNSGQDPRHLSGNNTYSGETKLNAILILDGAQALSENSKINSSSGELFLSKLAGAETEEYTINRVFTTDESSTLTLYVGLNATDAKSAGAVSGVTLNLGSQSNIKSSGDTICTVNVRGGNTVKVADGATLTGKYNLEQTATLVAQGAIANAIEGTGTVKVDGTGIVWDASGKTYTGTTALQANATVTTASSLTTGANSKITLAAGSQLTITGGLDSWTTGHTVSGNGTLVLNTPGELASGTLAKLITSGETLSTLELASGVKLTQNGSPTLYDTVRKIIVNSGAELIAQGDLSGADNLVDNTVELRGGTLKLNNQWFSSGLLITEDSVVDVMAGNTNANFAAGKDDAGVVTVSITGEGTEKLTVNQNRNLDFIVSQTISQLGTLEIINVTGATTTLNGAVSDVSTISLSGGTTKINGAVSNVSAFSSTGGTTTINGAISGMQSLTVQSGTTTLNTGAFNSTDNKLDIADSITVAAGATLSLKPSSKQHNDIVDGGTLGEPTSIGAELNMGADSVLDRPEGVLSLDGGLNLTGTVTMVTNWAKGMEIDSTVTGDADSTMKLTRASGAHDVQDLLVVKSDNSVSTAGGFAGTWDVASNFRLRADHENALADATVNLSNDAATLELKASTVNLKALQGVAGTDVKLYTPTDSAANNGAVATTGSTLVISNEATSGNNFAGLLADGVNVKLMSGYQALSGANQSGTHSFTAAGGVLDMTGYARAAVATTADGDEGTATPMPTVYDTIYAVGGQVVGLNLGAGMLLTGTSDAAAAMETITLGGSTVLGAGQMNFRVADSTNMIPGTENPYKRANTLYVVGAETGDTISLAGGGAKTLLNLSITNALTEILDPTEENAGDGYRDHTLISGLTLADTSAVASDFFATNLDGQDTGSTSYSLHFVQNAGNGLYDLVLRAMGGADTLFWNNAAGGTWEAADQTPDSWVKAQMVDGTPTPGTTTADFEQLDYVVFDDLTDGAGAAVPEVTITVADAGVNIGNMTVQADTTNYTIGGGAISSTAGNIYATLTKTGTGTLTLTGANSYAGNTTITGGTVIAQNEAALSNTQVQIYGAGTWLVFDYDTAAGGDGVFDATVKLDGSGSNPGGSLRALKDAEVNVLITGSNAPKDFHIATGKTLTLNALAAVSGATDLGGAFDINQDADGMSGTLKLQLADGRTYNHNKDTQVFAGEYIVSGNADTRLNDQKLFIAEGATARVQGGMTLQVTHLEGPLNAGRGKLVLEDASKLVYAKGSANQSQKLENAIESEGATLQIGGTNAATTTLTLKQGGLTLKGTETNAAADTTLSGGTWVLEQGAVAWDAAATGALAVAANTTVKVNDDTMKKLKVSGNNAKLATAKAGGSAAALSVETITVSNNGTVEGVNLTLTGTGSSIVGTVADVTVAQTGTITAGVPALELGSSTLSSLLVNAGEVQFKDYANVTVTGSVTVNGVGALLDLAGINGPTTSTGTTAAITIHAGGLDRAKNYAGQITIDDRGVAQTMSLNRVGGNALASILLKDIETATGVTKLTDLYRVKLADGSAFDLSDKLAEDEGNLLFDFENGAPADAVVSAATDATVTIGVNGVLGDVLDAGSVSYTIADKSIAPLASAVAWDATLALYNISATFGTDGKLTLSAVDVPLSPDDIYRSSEDNVGADGTQWAGNGPNVYSSSEPYASVYIDKDTVIDLTQAAAGDGEGLVLSNLIGRGNGANLTITGDGNDLVTINNNLEVTDVDSNLRSLSFNGDIDVTGTELQLLNTVATPGADNAGDLDTDSVYQINGALTADAASPVTITSGILKLNGKGSNASELLGGVTVENETGWLQVSGEASIGGTLQVSDELGVLDMTGDLKLLSGGKVTLLDGAVVDNGFGILGAGEGKETLSIAKGATATLSEVSHVQDVVLELQEGSKLVMNVDENTNKYGPAVDVDGLTGTGVLQGASSAAGYWPQVHITPQQDCTFSGDLSGYDGFIHVHSGKGTQTFDKVTTADDSEVELHLEGKSVINVAEENGNKTLTLRILKLLDGSDTTVEMNTDSGSPAIRINRSSATMKDGAALTLSSAAGEVLSADDDLLFMEGTGQSNLSDLDGKSITLDITDNAFRRLSETAKLVVEGDKVYVDLAASETNRYEEGASDPNAKAGAELLWNVDPSKLPADSALKAIDNAVAELMQNGNRDAAERALAATAGAGTAVLGSAFSADVERQLRAIRNRTTTMGVNQCEVNEGMPYVNAWINAEGDHREMDADGLAAGYTMDSWGGTVGFDVDITNHLTMGMAVTAMYGDLEADSADRAEGDFDTQYVSLFARVAHQAWTHTFVATLGRADVTLNRTVSVPGGSYESSGDTDGMAYGFMYEVARTFSLNEDGTTCWQPVFNVAWRHSSIDAYTESGADNALAVGEQDMNVLTFGAGARLQTVMGESLYNRASIFEARAMVKVDAGDREGEADVALLEGSTAASVKSAEIGAVGVEIGAGVTIPVGLNAGSIFIDGSAEFRSGYSNVNGTVGYRINF